MNLLYSACGETPFQVQRTQMEFLLILQKKVLFWICLMIVIFMLF